ncbi:MAG: fumarylacetoacetase, partial [Gemmatimonas sp.]|nr:fumarylacetoacetase [Gemmatimonas sp.]
MTPDPTIDPALRSWVETANAAECDFPIQNLPFGCFVPAEGQAARCGVAIGDRILDLLAARDAGLFDGLRTDVLEALGAESLTPLFATGRAGISGLRRRVSELLAASCDQQGRVADVLLPMSSVRMTMPAE